MVVFFKAILSKGSEEVSGLIKLTILNNLYRCLAMWPNLYLYPTKLLEWRDMLYFLSPIWPQMLSPFLTFLALHSLGPPSSVALQLMPMLL